MRREASKYTFLQRPRDSDLEGLPDLYLSRSYDLPLCLPGSFDCGCALPKGGVNVQNIQTKTIDLDKK